MPNLIDLHELRFTLKNHKKRLIEKYGYCAYCKSKNNLTLDHLIPISKGGTNSQENLVLACQPCNNKKADKDLELWLTLINQDMNNILNCRIIDKKSSPIEID